MVAGGRRFTGKILSSGKSIQIAQTFLQHICQPENGVSNPT